VDGLALAGQRRIIASRLPHEHEIVHVLAHVAISPAPPQNHPFVQEGLASYLGGHLGESPAAVLALGDDVLDRNPGLVRQLLTVRGFRDAPLPGSECYAAAARFLHYLDSMWGRSRLLSLLRLLAGFEDEVAARPASFVEVQFEGVYETSFDELLAGCDGWRRANPVAGIVATAPPGRSPDLVLSDREHRVRWWLESSGWDVAVTPLQDQLDLALRWGGAPPAPEAWTAPARRAGHELRITAEGGRLIDHGRPIVVLRWFEDPLATGVVSERAWFIPAESVGSIEVPPSADAVTLWSQPRFLVD
jgi:hypothetical protein